MAGHTAQVGDRFTTVVAARNKVPAPGTTAKALYYPSSPPENATYNPNRPEKYDLLNLPIRSQEEYYHTINRLSTPFLSARAQAKITTETGVSGLPLCAASEAFIHPTFFPLDPFHLFYENVMTFIWDIWTGVHAKEPDPVRLPDGKMKELGAYIFKGVATLPPSFCGPIRDPYEKRNSQFKIFEWMAILHWYFIPIAIELRLNQDVVQNFAKLVRIIEFAMTPIPRSEEELRELELLTRDFLVEFETVYVQGIPDNISRMRLCVFQLIHVPRHIKWNGSVRAGSQATTERLIGEFGRKISSQKSPYANLSNLIYEAELIKILCLYLPALEPPMLLPSDKENSSKSKKTGPTGLSQEHSVTIKARQDRNSALSAELDAIASHLENTGISVDLRSRHLEGVVLRRWGKYNIAKSDTTLRSRIAELKTTTARYYRWFEVCCTYSNADDMAIENAAIRNQPVKRIYGEAIAFYSIELEAKPDNLIRIAIYNPLKRVKHPLQCAVQGRWATDGGLCAVACSSITDVVGIWGPANSDNIYILRKHPGLSFLTEEERGQSILDSDNADFEDSTS
ncbi:hypothetical protein DFP72DRAFT_833862 [Ephemerocybe angulata]|uniref:Uncharacterized protein n=1 Tax=Ephemerocybe angulata TaxID=980116 RepID=A0A8H6LUA9_9AGAR|nr:hypothetical protein DFP72DRAFT_833862 [Tulosesus angulatus]